MHEPACGAQPRAGSRQNRRVGRTSVVVVSVVVVSVVVVSVVVVVVVVDVVIVVVVCVCGGGAAMRATQWTHKGVAEGRHCVETSQRAALLPWQAEVFVRWLCNSDWRPRSKRRQRAPRRAAKRW